ncbi:hypothetical protein LJC23_03685 [Desulfovibrio sp. OttesenSCG-928-I05]|nr:hypothetical protein [Desulfovibrio sp. OttesenSCG-928-I05]
MLIKIIRTAFYKRTNKDYAIIAKSGMFDEEFYLRKAPDVAKSGMDPLLHFCKFGWKERRNPSADFDLASYLKIYSDVQTTETNPLVHYLTHDQTEDRIHLSPSCEEWRAPIPKLETPADCERAMATLESKASVCLWASGGYDGNAPGSRQSVELFLYFKSILEKHQHSVVLFIRSNGIPLLEKFQHLASPHHVYECNDFSLLKHCKQINLVCSYEYVLPERPQGYTGKILIFPHNATVPAIPSHPAVLSADYAISPLKNPVATSFPFHKYPNMVKHGRFITFIKGNPKFDILAHRHSESSTQGKKYISFYPTLLSVSSLKLKRHGIDIHFDKKLQATYCDIIEKTIETYKDHTFVLRPDTFNIHSPFYSGIAKKFQNNKRFIYDTDGDNYRYLAVSDICMTDSSNIVRTFSMALFRPSIDLHICSDKNRDMVKHDFGYYVHNVEQAMQAIADAYRTMPEWQRTLRDQRAKLFPYPETTCEHIARHIPQIFSGENVADWTAIDKHDTPCTTVADWLRLLKGPDSSWLHVFPTPRLYPWAESKLGHNAIVALAALRAYLRQWSTSVDQNTLVTYKHQTDICLEACSPHHAYGMLRHMTRKNPDNLAAHVYFVETLTRYFPQDPLLSASLRAIAAKFPLQEIVISHMAARLLRLHDAMPAKKLSHLFATSFQWGPYDWPARFHPVYAGLLYEGNPAELKSFLSQWQASISGIYGINFLAFTILAHLASHDAGTESLPRSFWLNGEFRDNLTQYFTRKQLDEAAAALRALLLQSSPIQAVEINIHLARLYAAADKQPESLSCARAAEQTQLPPHLLWLHSKLADFYRARSDYKAIERITQKAIQKDPNQGWAHAHLSFALAARGAQDEALASARTAVAVNPDVLWLRDPLVTHLITNGATDEAENILRDTIRRDTNQAWPYGKLAQMYAARGDLDNAISFARQAVDREPQASWWRDALVRYQRMKEQNVQP